MRFRADQVIGVEEARQLLGAEADDMTDEDIQELIEDFDIIAQYALKMVQKESKNISSKVG